MADPLTLAMVGLTVAGGVANAAGEAKADAFKSDEAAAAARRGKIAAAETDAAYRQELTSVIGNIRAIRASAGISPDSPTTQAILESETETSDRQRRIEVLNRLSQAESDENASKFLASKSQDDFLFGTIGALGAGLGKLK